MRNIPDDGDETIKRIVDELRTLPPVPADATARVLARVDAARRDEGPSAYALTDDDDVVFFPTNTEEMRAASPANGDIVRPLSVAAGSRAGNGIARRFVVSLPAAIGYALAATLAGFLIRGAMDGASRNASSRSRATSYRSTRARCTRRCTAWSAAPGSRQTGAHRRTTGARSTTA